MSTSPPPVPFPKAPVASARRTLALLAIVSTSSAENSRRFTRDLCAASDHPASSGADLPGRQA